MHLHFTLFLFFITISLAQAQTDSPGKIYISHDRGATWQKADNGFPADDMVNAWVMKGDVLIAGTNAHGIYVTYDKTKNWYATGKGLPRQTRIMSMVVHDNIVFAGTYRDGLFYSTDNGDHWSAANGGLQNLNVRVLYSTVDALWAGVDNGLYKSTDGGKSWILKDRGIQVNAIRLHNNILYVATHLGVRSSVNGGETWTSIFTYGAISTLTVNNHDIFLMDYRGAVYRSPTGENVWLKADIYLPFRYTFRLTPASFQLFISDWQPVIPSLTSTKKYNARGIPEFVVFTDLMNTPFGLLASQLSRNNGC